MKIAGVAAATAALILITTGCGADARPAPGVLHTPGASSLPATDNENLRPCANVETITARLHVPMAQWYPQSKPFDVTVAGAVSTAAAAVQHEASAASGPARVAIHDWSTALAAMGTAMHGRDKALVLRRATGAQKSLVTIRTVCNFHEDR